jgi:hypothetical protein
VRNARLIAAPGLPDVYENFLRGSSSKKQQASCNPKSIAYFEEAIKGDSAFAPAYLGLANAYVALGKPGAAGLSEWGCQK